jgi:plasmid maintenance system antidote protein VapI
MTKLQYMPNYATHPGEIVESWLSARPRGTFKMLCANMGKDLKWGKRLLDCQIPITDDVAEALSKTLSTKKEFWINLQKNYEDARDRLM